MEKKEFASRLREIISTAKQEFIGTKFEAVNNWMGTPVNMFQYAATSERCMERNLSECGKKRKTTFMSDLSTGEWFGFNGVLDTVKNAVSSWKDDEEYMAEFVLCCNWKAWEHNARKNTQWVRAYSFLYDNIRDLMYDYYAEDEEKTAYMYEYLD